MYATNFTRLSCHFYTWPRSNYSPFFFNPLPRFSSARGPLSDRRIIATIHVEQTILINTSRTTVNAVSLKNFRLILFILARDVTGFSSVKSDRLTTNQRLKSIKHLPDIRDSRDYLISRGMRIWAGVWEV